MRLTFLGGAESIGASCALLEIDGERWIIDCGIRVKGSGGERLPDLAALEDIGAPTAILVTHAHLDHIGALPLLHQRFPLAPIYATAPTIDLTRVQLLDSLKIMEEARLEGELPLYSEAAVQSVIECMLPVVPLRPFHPRAQGPEVVFFPAGHIIGACSIGVSAREARVFWSGDISADNQRTIPGMSVPRFRADVAVVESTYGKRLHPDRSREEDRLVETVAEAIAAGGKVLIPAFAIGRAQEVILILMHAQRTGRIPPFPVWVDGMVRKACAIYASHPWYLQSVLRRRVEKHGDPFFGVLETVRPVTRPEERSQIVAGGPCAIVSSSGMLQGGPSTAYASALLEDERNLIAITGYQDEEAPGRQLLDAAAGRSESITLEGREVRPRCRISSYALSGHASGAQIAAIARALRPRDVFLVHGDAGARHDLAELFLHERIGRIHLPSHGDVLSPGLPRGERAPSRSSPRLRVTGIGGRAEGSGLAEEDARRLADHVLETYRKGASFTAEELHRIWYGTPPPDSQAARDFEDALRTSPVFDVHPRRLFEFLPRAPEAIVEEGTPWDANTLSERVDQALPPEAELLKKSYQPGETHMVLVFPFPERAREAYSDALDELFKKSGWTWEIHPQPNPGAVEREIRGALPEPRLLVRNPSLRLEERRAAVALSRALHPEELEEWEEMTKRVLERTGFAIDLEVRTGTPGARIPRDDAGRLELNLAYARIRAAFASEPHQPYRLGRKPGGPGAEDVIELAFISHQVGSRYEEKLEELEKEIGWPIVVSPRANQYAIVEAARGLLSECSLRKGPSFHGAAGCVHARIARALEPAHVRQLEEAFHERTGFELRIEMG